MIYVLLSVCCSVIVSVLLKLAKRYSIDIFQAITWNYSMAMILTWLIYRPVLNNVQGAPVSIYGSLAVLLPSLFVVIGMAVKTAGIARTDVAQRLSLFISLTAAFLLFNEAFTAWKFAGLIVGFAAILCAIPWSKQTGDRDNNGSAWIYLLVVFVGFGVIDILFKQMATFKGVPFPVSLFFAYLGSFVLSLIVLAWMVFTGRLKSPLRHIFFGWVLGVANFGNILFYLKAHQALSANPSTVFSAMNIGVITLGTIIGMVVFKEKLTTLNKIGIVLAIIAIVIITYTQTH
ncbi:EamA/RhaT family transporter [Mucilaginibacter mali]|uniref:EamA/RhaT family transporter n=1 Tax=Mucilaginibacter mali TaxID=2740462 RepID=A0A7D4UAB8_9SPHI|nr:EamA/RhaT family transporter [Mucilaginibacter mali]QKJ29818.1 EamA/RhaT family transporter [Mucilaginibacter mali]